MRLIDADAMLERLESWNTKDKMDSALYNFAWYRIMEQPTAYEVERVCEKIGKIEVGGDCRYNCKHYDWSVGACQGICEEYVRNRAIEIARKGGK